MASQWLYWLVFIFSKTESRLTYLCGIILLVEINVGVPILTMGGTTFLAGDLGQFKMNKIRWTLRNISWVLVELSKE